MIGARPVGAFPVGANLFVAAAAGNKLILHSLLVFSLVPHPSYFE